MISCEILTGRRRDERRGPVTVESRTWGISLHADRLAAGFTYGHPSGLRAPDGRRVRIVDHLMLVRLAGAAAVLLAYVARRLRS